MKTFLALFLTSACGAVYAQSPAANPMPDGSRDMYVGVGAASSPEYAGARERSTSAQPLIQMEWSSGIFVSGLSAGMHLSQRPALEFGPLLSIHRGRDRDGNGGGAGGVTDPLPGFVKPSELRTVNGLRGMHDIKTRLQAGGFLNYYVTPTVRVTSSLLYGAGNEHDGLVLNLAVQRIAAEITPHHRISVSAGLNAVNRGYNASFFGVSGDESRSSGYAPYAPGAGIRDVYVGAGWNWALSPSWMVASGARISRLQGDARNSPLVQRPTNFSVSTGLAYRF
jgi:outer membrane scaffolding protein for murein synthesis (MipA/OmpV family)